MDEPLEKRVDESWKEQAEREKHAAAASAPRAGQVPGPQTAAGDAAPQAEELPQARFDLFLSSLVMEAFVALGDMAHPTTRKQAANLPQARYLIDLLGVLDEKTTGNRSVDEDALLKDALYRLRMRYLTKAGR